MKQKHIVNPLALFTLTLTIPHQTTAQCPACDTCSAALKQCQTTSTTNITTTGNTLDTASVHCMCVTSSSATQMNSCRGCRDASNLVTGGLDLQVLLAWYYTCNADDQFGEGQAKACWESQPGSFLPCVSNTGGKGATTMTNGGLLGGMAPTSAAGG